MLADLKNAQIVGSLGMAGGTRGGVPNSCSTWAQLSVKKPAVNPAWRAMPAMPELNFAAWAPSFQLGFLLRRDAVITLARGGGLTDNMHRAVAGDAAANGCPTAGQAGRGQKRVTMSGLRGDGDVDLTAGE